MPRVTGDNLLAAVLDSWDRNNRILVNLLRALPPGSLDARVMPTSPSVTEMFMHMVYVRLVFVSEDAPHHAAPLPPRQSLRACEPEPTAPGLDSIARILRAALEERLRSARPMQ